VQRGIVGFDGENGLFQFLRVDVVGLGIDIDEDRCGAEEADDLRRGDEGEGRGENGIAGTYIVCHQGHKEGVGAGGAADGVFHADIGSQFLLQFLHFRSHDVIAMGEDPLHTFIQLFFDSFLLCFKINKIHLIIFLFLWD
jgi:hypothetical protein